MGYLRNCKFQSFILWGRSMGASSALYYALKEHLDSSFSTSFEKILFLTMRRSLISPTSLRCINRPVSNTASLILAMKSPHHIFLYCCL